MLGEAATKEIAVRRDARGFDENKSAAKMGGKIAGDARRQLEADLTYSSHYRYQKGRKIRKGRVWKICGE